MTPEERVTMAIRLFAMNETMRDLRATVDAAADVSKMAGATDLAFATYFLSDSIAAYMEAVNRYFVREFSELPRP